MNNKKDLAIVIIIGGLFVLLLGYVFLYKNNSSTTPSDFSTSTTTTTTTVQKDSTTSTKDKKTNTTKPKTISPGAATPEYVAALNTYRNSGYYFQLSNCGANPGSLTMKRGTKFMIDNRDAKAHRIAIGSKTITVQGYGYAIVTADKIGTNQITCDGGGAGLLNVQP